VRRRVRPNEYASLLPLQRAERYIRVDSKPAATYTLCVSTGRLGALYPNLRRGGAGGQSVCLSRLWLSVDAGSKAREDSYVSEARARSLPQARRTKRSEWRPSRAAWRFESARRAAIGELVICYEAHAHRGNATV
jgi:hypothetical protein